MAIRSKSCSIFRCRLFALALFVIHAPLGGGVSFGPAEAIAAAPENEEGPNPAQLVKLFSQMSKAYTEAKFGDREAIEKRLAALDTETTAQDWALSRFERERRSVDQMGNPTWYMQLLNRSKEAKRQWFVHHPEASKGEIITGVALNFFLEECGPSAVAHSLILARAAPRPPVGPGNPARPGDLTAGSRIRTDLAAAEVERRRILIELTGTVRFSERDLMNVVVKRGFAGKTFKVRLNDQPLPLDWPEVMRSEKVFHPLMKEIETTKEIALNQLAKRPANALDVGLAPATSLRFRLAADRLYSTFSSELEKRMEFGMHPESRIEWVVAQRYVLELSRGVSRFCEARNAQDVTIPRFPPDGQAVSIVEFLAFMSRHGYRFGEADDTGWETYHALYEEMRRYYVDLYAIRAAMNENRTEQRKLVLADAILLFDPEPIFSK